MFSEELRKTKNEEAKYTIKASRYTTKKLRFTFFMLCYIGMMGETMGRLSDERLIYEILSIVEEIPEGRVATYGQIARLIGRERNARLVGTVLSRADCYGQYPCHRVVNHAGRLVPGWVKQAELLRQEGVVLMDDCHVDLKTYQWDM